MLKRLVHVVLIFGFCYFVWPTPWTAWRFVVADGDTVLVRVSRFSGEVQVNKALVRGEASGWQWTK